MLIHFDKMQRIKKLVLFVMAVIIAQPAFGMAMEQYEYTLTSNARGIEVSFGGQMIKINKSSKTVKVAAPFSPTVDFIFPENKENTYSVLRTDLPGDLIIEIRRFAEGEYTIRLSSEETGERVVVNFDIQ